MPPNRAVSAVVSLREMPYWGRWLLPDSGKGTGGNGNGESCDNTQEKNREESIEAISR